MLDMLLFAEYMGCSNAGKSKQNVTECELCDVLRMNCLDLLLPMAIGLRDERCTEKVSASSMPMAWPFFHCNLDVAGFFTSWS